MSYTRVNWEDSPSTNTPVNAENLNKMDAGIKVIEESLGTAAYKGVSTTVNDSANLITSAAVKAALEEKVDKEEGMGLSAENYSTAEKNKLSGIDENANNYSHPNSGVTAGTYKSVTVDTQGHVTGGSNPTQPINQGGTGATTAAAALVKLGITAGTADLTAGTSSLASGTIYIVYE